VFLDVAEMPVGDRSAWTIEHAVIRLVTDEVEAPIRLLN
jgi:hypothetical protein